MIRDLIPGRDVRLLRAKAAELEADVADSLRRDANNTIAYLTADIALIATLLADHIERTSTAVEVNESDT